MEKLSPKEIERLRSLVDPDDIDVYDFRDPAEAARQGLKAGLYVAVWRVTEERARVPDFAMGLRLHVEDMIQDDMSLKDGLPEIWKPVYKGFTPARGVAFFRLDGLGEHRV